ncbi:MAG: Ger(x)C family spore germination protein [Bacilli bacterium]|nr:Ger(x)C family spore germination protein [Bacilli bacterium]
MKKVILIIMLLLMTGCYDYVEINDLSFVSCIGIDYENDSYKLTYEILNDTKTGSEQASQKGYTVNGSGKSLAKAFNNISLNIAKKPYFYHLKAIVISEDVAKDHMKELIEFVTRDPEIRNGFYLVVAKDVSAKEIVENSTESNPIVGNQITKLIESNTKGYNITFSKAFEDVLEKFLNNKIDPITSAITISNKELKAEGIATFQDFDYVYTLSAQDSSYLNLLLNEQTNFLVSRKYDDKEVIINIADGKSDYNFENKTITIDISIEGEIRENMPEFNLRKEQTYIDLANDFEKTIKSDIEDLLSSLTKENLDVLGLENMYYKKTRKENDSILKYYNIKVNVNLEINKKGLIFEVEYE